MESSFAYADTSGWAEWQKEYLYGALYIFPPGGIIEAVDQLRRRYDPRSANAAQAHISLSEPLPGPLTGSQVEELRRIASQFEPFMLHYGPLRSFPPYPGVTYAISPEDQFMQLRAAIHSISIFKDSRLSRKDIPPHMTIAEFISMEETERLLGALSGKGPQGAWLVRDIEYAVPDEHLYFHRVLTIGLG
ncbi:MAG: 2'-5' RNA ligase family protein, partial [Chloroflexi bacterium]|nr:2'-5' RNA ligase family protein [Chloroflexota bacterium]